MATKLKLYSQKQNKNAYKALVAAKFVGVDVELPASWDNAVDSKTPEFLKKNPNGKV